MTALLQYLITGLGVGCTYALTGSGLVTIYRVTRVVKLLGMVNCAPDFEDQPKVINAASDILVEAFGDAGKHARSAVGMSSLPFQISVEIEMIVEVRD